MALDLSVCRLGGIEPLQLAIKTNPVSSTSSASTRGIAVTIGEDSELFSMRPAANFNNTVVTTAYTCGNNPNASCIARHGGLYTASNGVIQTGDDNAWNGTPGELGSNGQFRIIGFEDVMRIGKFDIPDMPLMSFEEQSTGATPFSLLALGTNSSFLEYALGAKAIGTKQWSYWPGNLFNDADGLLVIGAYDQNRVADNFATYQVDWQYDISVDVIGMDWEDASGQTTSLMPNDTKSFPATIDPFYDYIDMTADSIVQFMFLTNFTILNETTVSPQWNSRPNGNLVIQLSDGEKTVIPAEDLFDYPKDYNARGYLEDLTTSYWEARLNAKSTQKWLGYPFLAQKVLVTDWDRGAIHLANANKDSIALPDLKPLCTDPPPQNSNGTAPTPPAAVATSKSTPVAAIAGGVVGGVGGLLVIGIIAFFVLRRRRKQKERKQHNPDSYSAGAPESYYRGSTASAPPKYPVEGIYETDDKMTSPERYHSPPPHHATRPPQEMDSPPLMSTHSAQPLSPQGNRSINSSPTPDTGSNSDHWHGLPSSASMATAPFTEASSKSRFGATSGPLEMPVDYDERYAK